MEEVMHRASAAGALIERPARAVVQKDGAASTVTAPPVEAQPAQSEAQPPTRDARIRAAAYARYEQRGCVHGHDLDDWLAAEAELQD